jgi:serine/threonine protein kinase
MGLDIQLLFRDVADLSPGDRERYFDSRGVPAQVRQEIESLLCFDGSRAETLGGCVSNVVSELFVEAGPRAGGRCGPYELVRLLGRGGMGAVFLAQRTDGEVEQLVAIKFVRDDAAGPVFRERFLRERQILASLSHPGIARLLDAGHTAAGQPYLVMEYIDGIAIDVYAAKLDLAAKLRLFLQVCEAISYAHRNLVIHRDLKPSNILVDSSGGPKLLDFGIARILDEVNRGETRERLMSSDYASPEQVRGDAHSTATDVYSLAALLYALVTGRSPHTPEPGSQDPIEVQICLREPAPPSRYNPALPRDLDFVVAKGLRKEPEDRYTGVDALAADIRALLECRPVQARSGSRWYQTRKFLRRHWLPASAVAAAMLSLSIGLYTANRQRAIAQQRFLEVRQLSGKLFDIDTLVRDLPGGAHTRQFIVDTSLDYLRRVVADARMDPGLTLEVGNAYLRVARVQGVPIGPNLGQLDKAEHNLEIADRLMHSVLVEQPGNRTALLRAAQIAHDRMLLAGFQNRGDDARNFAAASAKWLEKFHADKRDGAQDSSILNTYLNVANYYVSHREYDKALSLTGRAVDLAVLYDFPAYKGTLQWVRARVFQRQANLDEALRAIQESVALLDSGKSKTKRGQLANLSQALVYEGHVLDDENGISLNQPAEAVKALQRGFDVADGLVHQDTSDHNDRGSLANAAVSLAAALRRSHEDARALAIYDHALAHLSEVKSDMHLQTFVVRLLAGSTYSLRRLGRSDEARRRLANAFQVLAQLKEYPAAAIETGSDAEEALRAQAEQEAATGNLPRAGEMYGELLERVAASKPELDADLADAADVSSIDAAASAVYLRAGQPDRASELDARRMDLWRRWDQRLPHNGFVQRQLAAGSVAAK